MVEEVDDVEDYLYREWHGDWVSNKTSYSSKTITLSVFYYRINNPLSMAVLNIDDIGVIYFPFKLKGWNLKTRMSKSFYK